MAARENWPLRAALVLCVCVLVVLAVSCYVLDGKLQTAVARAVAAEQRLEGFQETARVAQAEASRLKEMIGHSPLAEFVAVEREFQADRAASQMYSSPNNPAPAAYRTFVVVLLEAARNAVGREIQLRQEAAQVRSLLGLERTSFARQLAAQEQVRATLAGDLQAVQAAARQDREQWVRTWEDLHERFLEGLRQLELWQARYDELARRFSQELKLAHGRYGQLRDEWETLLHDEFEQPLGRIVEINAERKTVLINLGYDDHLPRSLTLGVYDSSTASPRRHSLKGRLEVTSILGPHVAEARMVSEQLRDPLLRGDFIFTPVWRPGQPRHFALAGGCDLNHDGQSDTRLLRQLVESTGGVLDAELNEQGQKTGELGVAVRYLIVGSRPRGAAVSKEVVAYERFLAEAKELGIDLISLDKFLELAGWRDHSQVVKFDRAPRARPREVPDR